MFPQVVQRGNAVKTTPPPLLRPEWDAITTSLDQSQSIWGRIVRLSYRVSLPSIQNTPNDKNKSSRRHHIAIRDSHIHRLLPPHTRELSSDKTTITMHLNEKPARGLKYNVVHIFSVSALGRYGTRSHYSNAGIRDARGDVPSKGKSTGKRRNITMYTNLQEILPSQSSRET